MSERKKTASHKARNDRLQAKVVGGRLVISIGVETLAWATEHATQFYDGDNDHFFSPHVTDPDEFARDVVRELEREEEDGTTPLHVLIDKMTLAAVEDGSLGVAEDYRIVPAAPLREESVLGASQDQERTTSGGEQATLRAAIAHRVQEYFEPAHAPTGEASVLQAPGKEREP